MATIAKYLVLLTLLLGAVAVRAQQPQTAAPQDKTQPSPRLNPSQLTARMVRDLRLNGYQATRLEAINAAQQQKLAAIAQKNAGNQQLIDQQCDEVCQQRDAAVRAVLSNDQYTRYYGRRSDYNEFAKNYAIQAGNAEFVQSVRDPLPASSRGAVIKPASTAPDPRPASTRARGKQPDASIR